MLHLSIGASDEQSSSISGVHRWKQFFMPLPDPKHLCFLLYSTCPMHSLLTRLLWCRVARLRLRLDIHEITILERKAFVQ